MSKTSGPGIRELPYSRSTSERMHGSMTVHGGGVRAPDQGLHAPLAECKHPEDGGLPDCIHNVASTLQ